MISAHLSTHACDVDGWPKHMHLKFEHFENDLPFNRMPLSEHVQLLSDLLQQKEAKSGEDGEGLDGATREDRHSPVPAGAPWPSPEPIHVSHAASHDDSSDDDSLANELIGPAVKSASESGSGQGSDQHLPSASLAPKRKLQGSFLKDALISELHPASWFAVAWYPVYRIPDAPLCARFLTFHSFAPLLAAMQGPAGPHRSEKLQKRPEGPSEASSLMNLVPTSSGQGYQAGTDGGDVVSSAATQTPSEIQLQVVGLKWYNMHGERWLEPMSDEEAIRQQQQQYTLSSGTESGATSGRRVPRPVIDHAWQVHLGELQGTAERLARGQGLRLLGPKGAEEVKSRRHSDFEFFNSRS